MSADRFQTTHGHATGKRTPEYRAWHDMKQRCSNPNHSQWKNYGARGIVVCEEWKTFINFLSDMGLRMFPYLSLDRKDNDGPYSADNCRWAIQVMQDWNRRTCRMLEHRGVRRPLKAWAQYLEMTDHSLRRWLEVISLDAIMSGATITRGSGSHSKAHKARPRRVA
jgi:hypothetical protein